MSTGRSPTGADTGLLAVERFQRGKPLVGAGHRISLESGPRRVLKVTSCHKDIFSLTTKEVEGPLICPPSTMMRASYRPHEATPPLLLPLLIVVGLVTWGWARDTFAGVPTGEIRSRVRANRETTQQARPSQHHVALILSGRPEEVRPDLGSGALVKACS